MGDFITPTADSAPWVGTTTGDAGPYSDDKWSEIWRNAFMPMEGVLPLVGEGLQLDADAPASADVIVQTGACMIQGKYCPLSSDTTITIAANASGQDRIDRIVGRITYATQEFEVVRLAGTPAASPAAPGLTQTAGVQWEIPLWQVYVSNGFATITADDLTDERHWFYQAKDTPPHLRYLTAATFAVLPGQVPFGYGLIWVPHTVLDMADNDDWIGGSSVEAATQHVYVYTDEAGNVLLHNKAPVYPFPDVDSIVFDALVNQAGWNGTAGQGLNATSVVYDNDTGEINIQAGMWLGIFKSTDTDYSVWRGYGSASAGGYSVPSQYALITSVDTATNTLSLLGGHNIAINDGDILIAIAGTPRYRLESGTWYRCIGSMFNNASSNLDSGHIGIRDLFESFTYDSNTNSTSFVAISSTLDRRVVLLNGGELRAAVEGHGTCNNAAYEGYVTIYIDGINRGDSSVGMARSANAEQVPMHFTYESFLLAPGVHIMQLYYRVTNALGQMRWRADRSLRHYTKLEENDA